MGKEKKTQGGPGSVRFGYSSGVERFERFRFSVPAVPLQKRFFCVSVQFNRKGRFRFRFLENGSGGSGSAFGFGKNGSDGSGSRFRFGSWSALKTNKHKEFWRDTPWCASRLSRGHVPSVPWYVPSVPGTFCPFSIDLHRNQAQMSQVSLGRPEFVPGTSPGHPTAKFLYVIFLYRFFLSLSMYWNRLQSVIF